MDPISATPPETPPTPYEAWRRFTLLDLLILFTGHEAALGLIKWYGLMGGEGPLFPSLTPVPILAIVYLFFILGGVLSIPVVLFVQFYFRQRREDAKGGEYFAVGYCILWTIVFINIRSFPMDMITPIFITTFIASPIFIYGGCCFVKCLLKSDRKAGCKWLGLYGYFLCFVSVVFLLWGLILPGHFFD
jgi:hypothetical protein